MNQLDPIYFGGRNYYLLPDAAPAEKAYAVLHRGLTDRNRVGIARVVWHGRPQAVLIRPVNGMLAMSFLHFEPEIVKPSTFAHAVPAVPVEADESQLTSALIEAKTAKPFTMARYQDRHTDQLKELIDAKIVGRELVAPPVHEHRPVVNLMDALRQSLAEIQADVKPPRKMAPSKPPAGKERKRKSG